MPLPGPLRFSSKGQKTKGGLSMNELTLFNQENKSMTIKEIAEILKVSEKHIRTIIKKVLPEKLKHGIRTLLNEHEVTQIKIELEKNPYLDQSVELVKTDYEMAMRLVESATYFKEKYDDLLKENTELKPKAIAFDTYMNTKDLMTVSIAAKELNYGPKKLFIFLRENNYFMPGNIPYQKYIDNDYFQLKKTFKHNGEPHNQPFVTQRGLEAIRHALNKTKEIK
jgi:phage antirepressor YoqD-like protein